MIARIQRQQVFGSFRDLARSAGQSGFPFSPSDWFKVSDLAGLSDMDPCGEPGVSDLENHGSNSEVLEYFGLSYAPRYRSAIIGSDPGIEHASGDRMIKNGSVNFDTLQAGFTLAWVGNKTSVADGPFYYNSNGQYMWMLDASITVAVKSGAAKAFTEATADNTPYSLAITVEDNLDNTAEVRVFKDGAEIAPSDADNTQGYTKAQSPFNTIGRSSSTDGCVWAEFLFWNKVLTPAQVAEVVAYFKSHYAALPA
jgi:hypothetical protein